ncbi:YlbL family protein [Paenibacillus sp. LPE1-1-1.1]|uniref:YlbL family protein n=1 Tax=Paenibacillus sp. LPE1-1-1.1 TaxID=3135230 RepID=UPI003412F103
MQKQRSDLRRIAIVAAATAVFMWVLLYAPTPYVVYEPGIAVPVKPMLTVEAGDELGEGDFLLTAVKLTEPNLLHAISAMMNSNKEVHPKRTVLRGYTQEQYAQRQRVIMQGSQNNAIEAAYRSTGLPYESKALGIVIADVPAQASAGSAAFQTGDLLLGIHGEKPSKSIQELLESLQRMSGNKTFSFDTERNGQRMQVVLPADRLLSIKSNEQLMDALGIRSITEIYGLEPANRNNRITITAGDIGGPSAGLVFALQALDLLTEGDLSGGSRIAATGTITVDGKVGAIGGIKQKIVVASEAGAQLFLVPADNFEEAEAKAQALGASMKVVSVSTLEEALEQIEMFRAGTD